MSLIENDHLNFADAKKKAHKELLSYFGFDNLGDAENINIFGQGDDSAATPCRAYLHVTFRR